MLLDSLHRSRPLGPSKIRAWAKNAKALLAEPLCFLINQFNAEENSQIIFKKIVELHFLKEEIPKTHSIIDLFLSFLFCQKVLKRRYVHKSQVS